VLSVRSRFSDTRRQWKTTTPIVRANGQPSASARQVTPGKTEPETGWPSPESVLGAISRHRIPRSPPGCASIVVRMTRCSSRHRSASADRALYFTHCSSCRDSGLACGLSRATLVPANHRPLRWWVCLSLVVRAPSVFQARRVRSRSR